MRRKEGDVIEGWASGRVEGTWAIWPGNEGIICSCSVDDLAPRSEFGIVDCRGCKGLTDRIDASGEDNDDEDANAWEGSKGNCIDPLLRGDKPCSLKAPGAVSTSGVEARPRVSACGKGRDKGKWEESDG